MSAELAFPEPELGNSERRVLLAAASLRALATGMSGSRHGGAQGHGVEALDEELVEQVRAIWSSLLAWLREIQASAPVG